MIQIVRQCQVCKTEKLVTRTFEEHQKPWVCKECIEKAAEVKKILVQNQKH
jgi:ribosomal protein L37AE/L43A